MGRTPWTIDRQMFLSVEETAGLLAHVRRAGRSGQPQALVDALIVESLLFSGLRTSEFCELRVADTVIGSGQSCFVVRGRRGADRTVYVPQRVSEAVLRYVERVRPQFLPERVRADDRNQPLVFNEHRRPYERTGLYRRVVRILTEAGLGQRASVQLLRHTYGYLAYLRTGGNLLFVQRQLGHAHPMVTSIYAQFVEEPYSELADRVAGAAISSDANVRRRIGARP